jgi:hypothetical protein
VDDYVRFPDDFLPLGNNSHTIIEWINPAKICSDCMTMFHYGQCTQNQLRLLFFRSNSITGVFVIMILLLVLYLQQIHGRLLYGDGIILRLKNLSFSIFRKQKEQQAALIHQI